MVEKEYKNRVYNKETKEETKIWKEMCKYIETEIMGYDDNQKLSKQMCLRLRGIISGKQIANAFIPSEANYSYEIMFYAFKINKMVILQSVSGKTFSSEWNKFLYIAAIIENNINDVYMRIQNSKKSKERTETLNIDNINYEGADYTRKTEDLKVSKKTDGLW